MSGDDEVAQALARRRNGEQDDSAKAKKKSGVVGEHLGQVMDGAQFGILVVNPVKFRRRFEAGIAAFENDGGRSTDSVTEKTMASVARLFDLKRDGRVDVGALREWLVREGVEGAWERDCLEAAGRMCAAIAAFQPKDGAAEEGGKKGGKTKARFKKMFKRKGNKGGSDKTASSAGFDLREALAAAGGGSSKRGRGRSDSDGEEDGDESSASALKGYVSTRGRPCLVTLSCVVYSLF